MSPKCIVRGCSNRKDQGTFVGDICLPCYSCIVTGVIGPTDSFLGKMKKNNSALCSILDELFGSFRPYNPSGISPGVFFECILGCNHLDRLKKEYANLKEEPCKPTT